MVSTLDFESGDPSSNLGGTLSCVGYFYLVVQIVAKNRKINIFENNLVASELFIEIMTE